MSTDEYVRRVVDRAPPLTAHQVSALRTLIVPALPQRTRTTAASKAA